MSWHDVVDQLTQEAILLDPGNLVACGKMLKLAESLGQPEIAEHVKRLKACLEALIMRDIEGDAPDVDDIIAVVDEIKQILEGKPAPGSLAPRDGGHPADAPEGSQTAMFPDTGTPAVPAEASEHEDVEDFVIEDPALIKDFIAEAMEHLDSIEVNLVEWEKNPNDREIINSVFRPFHTIKGVAGFLNLHGINRTAHQLENLLDECREGRLHLSPDLSDLIFDGVDVLKMMIARVEASLSGEPAPAHDDPDTDGLYGRIRAFTDRIRDDGRQETGKSAAAGKLPLGEILVREGKVTPDVIARTLEEQAAKTEKKPLGEMLVEEKKLSRRDVRDAVRRQTELVRQSTETYIKVETQKMDHLLDMVGELVISQSMVTQNPLIHGINDQRLTYDIAQLGRVTKTLQNITMSLRMVPIGATFQKMNRIVRDLARKSGKKINLVIEGQSAEIDRNMVEELYDPLLHMIRNSCDHGIQTPERRVSVGKPEEGTVLLKAEHAGGRVVITIRDDGEGLNRDEILRKAWEKGIVPMGERPEDRLIDNMIMMPGFSTAKQITDVSGRGVGMDVVKKAIEKLRGILEISSVKGAGTTFTIKLPLTTAIIDGMLVKIGRETYIIPTLSVRQVIRPGAADINIVMGRGETVNLRGKILPIIRLHHVLDVGHAVERPEDAVLIVVDDNGREVALLADALLGKQEVVIKNLGEKLRNLKGVAGGAIMGDGRVALILDLQGILGNTVSVA